MASYGKRMLKAVVDKTLGPPNKRKRCSPLSDAKFWCECGLDKDGLTKRYINEFIGMGVFTTCCFMKGDFLLEYVGEKISSNEAQKRERRGNSYIFGYKYNGNFHWMDAANSRASRLCALVNDAEEGSAKCNARMKLKIINGSPRLCLFAERDINQGEEVRYDYGDDPAKLTWRYQQDDLNALGEVSDDDPFDVERDKTVQEKTASETNIDTEGEKDEEVISERIVSETNIDTEGEKDEEVISERIVSETDIDTEGEKDEEVPEQNKDKLRNNEKTASETNIDTEGEKDEEVISERIVSETNIDTEGEKDEEVISERIVSETDIDTEGEKDEEVPEQNKDKLRNNEKIASESDSDTEGEEDDDVPEQNKAKLRNNGYLPDETESDIDISDDDEFDETYHPEGDESSSEECVSCSEHETEADTSILLPGLNESVNLSDTAINHGIDENGCSSSETYSEVIPVIERNITFETASRSATGVYSNKKHCCIFCDKVMYNIARHYESQHANEMEVARIIAYPKKSKLRRKLWQELVNRGDFAHNFSVIEKGSGTIIPKKRKSKQSNIEDYIPCPYCKAFYQKTELWKHKSFCVARDDSVKERESTVRMGRLLLPSSCANAAFEKNVLNIMKEDQVKQTIISDQRIIGYGTRLYEKHGQEQHKIVYISQKLREIGRLVLFCKENTAIKSLDELIEAKNWNILVNCVREVCGYNSEKRRYNTPSLALKIGHSLQKCAKYLKSEGIKESNKEKIKVADAFSILYESDWNDEISNQALASLSEKRYNKPLLLPLVEDVVTLNKMINERAVELREKIEKFPELYPELAQICLTQVILFNRRRSGEAERITLKAFKTAIANESTEVHSSVTDSLNEFEKSLCKSHLRIEIKGKRGRKVPVLLTQEMKKSLEILVKYREKADVTQPLLFAKPGKLIYPYRGTDCLRKFANEAKLKNPSLITSTKLRKQLATLAQILNLSESSQDILATFQGHDIRVHREYYRLPETTLQIAKVSKLLHSINDGTITKFKGKDFNEIEFDDEEKIASESDSDTEGEEDDDVPEQNKAKLRNNDDVGEDEKTKKTIKRKTIKKVPSVRHQWTREEKEALRRQFKRNINLGKTPGQLECLNAMRAEQSLKGFTWRNIKFAVKNLITSRNRLLK